MSTPPKTANSPMLDEHRPNHQWVQWLFPVALIFIAACLDRGYQTDLWHHLSRGRVLVEEGILLNHDRFTYTVEGQPLQDVNWLWQATFYQLYRWGGMALVQTTNALVLALTLGLLVGFCQVRSRSSTAAFLVGTFAFVGLWQLLLIRPQTLSFFLFVLLMIVLEAGVQNRWWLLAAPAILAFWANVHGGFPIGLVLVGSYGLAAGLAWLRPKFGWEWLVAWEEEDPPRTWASVVPWGACLLGCLTATLANPYGYRVYTYVVQTSSRAYGRRIDEWLPPSVDTVIGNIWVLSLLLLVLSLACSRRRPSLRELCLVLCFLPMACRSVRMLAWWFLILSPILAVQFASTTRRSEQSEDSSPRTSSVLCVLLLLLMVWSTPWFESYNPFLHNQPRGHRLETDLHTTSEQIRSLKENGRIFTQFAWGEYLGWELGPDFKVFMDGRIEIIPDSAWADYTAITRAREDWEQLLLSANVDFLVLDRRSYHRDLIRFVGESPRWEHVSENGPVVLYRRK